MATQYQIEVLKNKLAEIKSKHPTGNYPKKYYALETKIKKLKQTVRTEIKRKSWFDFLAQ